MRKLLSVLSILLALFVASCDDYDKWTTSADARLTFSSDTVSFDTVITALSSPTQQLLVFNNNSEGLRISHVQLASGGNSLFRVNVDGQYLASGSGDDFEIRGEDSMFVKVEVQLPEGNVDTIQHYEDRLDFTLESGLVQHVFLKADGQNVYVLRGKTFEKDDSLVAGRPFLIYDSLVVAEGAKLTIKPGVKLYFHDEVNLKVKGTLDAQGTLEQPIVFRGDRLDHLFSYLPYDNTTNRWGGIIFTRTSVDNVLNQCDIHSGTFGVECDSSLVYDVNNPMLTMKDCILHNIGGLGLSLKCCCTQIIGTQISNTLGQCVKILGGNNLFVHCTIAQFYPFSADRGAALNMLNRLGEKLYPIDRVHFLNCVITGYADDVITADIKDDDQDNPVNYLFANCLLRTVSSDDTERFVNITYDNSDLDPNGSGHFKLFDTTYFQYDFTPVEGSAIRGKADAAYTLQYSPVDRRGTSRFVGETVPDMGAYQFVAPE